MILKVKVSGKFFKLKMWLWPHNPLTESLTGPYRDFYMYPELHASEEYRQDIPQESKQHKP